MMDQTQLNQVVDNGMTAIFQAYSQGQFAAALAAKDQMVTDIQALCTSTHETPPEE